MVSFLAFFHPQRVVQLHLAYFTSLTFNYHSSETFTTKWNCNLSLTESMAWESKLGNWMKFLTQSQTIESETRTKRDTKLTYWYVWVQPGLMFEKLRKCKHSLFVWFTRLLLFFAVCTTLLLYKNAAGSVGVKATLSFSSPYRLEAELPLS